MNFSHRTDWHRRQNRVAELLDKLRTEGRPIIDLTESNPTKCGFCYPADQIRQALSQPAVLEYNPDPRGLLSARASVSAYYLKDGIAVDPSEIFLTAGTSESYSHLFKLLCNPGDNLLVPQPSYPLFDYLAELNDVKLQTYRLQYDHEWQIDIDSLRRAITSTTKALVIVSPHNPTGMILKQEEYEEIRHIARRHRLAIISDEVFGEYAFNKNAELVTSAASEDEILTFVLNGISKLAGLPQVKLGWIIVRGTDAHEAEDRLEILCDTFLSVGTPIQIALSSIMTFADGIRTDILKRVKNNYAFACSAASGSTSLLESAGGWYAVLRVPRTTTDEEWVLSLLEERGISLFPGYFFDFEEEGFLVVSLLPEEPDFRRGFTEAAKFINDSVRR